jgi:hypothetical protein
MSCSYRITLGASVNNKLNILKHSRDELQLLKVILSFILFKTLSISSIMMRSYFLYALMMLWILQEIKLKSIKSLSLSV